MLCINALLSFFEFLILLRGTFTNDVHQKYDFTILLHSIKFSCPTKKWTSNVNDPQGKQLDFWKFYLRVFLFEIT